MAEATLDNFVLSKDPKYRKRQEAALAAVKSYLGNLAENVKKGIGLWLRGTCGTGKDHLLAAAGKVAIRQDGLRVVRVSGPELFRNMRAAISEDTESHELKRHTSPDILILSDPLPVVGEFTTFQAQTLYDLVDTRNVNMRPTWTTLNITSNEEADRRLTPAIADRLRHEAIEIECVWPSYRTERDTPVVGPSPRLARRAEPSDFVTFVRTMSKFDAAAATGEP